MMKKTTIIIATLNENKIYELSKLLKNFPVNLKSLKHFDNVPTIIEDGSTFQENAYKKASVTAKILGLPSLADDSGLVINALNGNPGIYSARYGGETITDIQRCNIILNELKNNADRSAYFKCILSLALPEGQSLTYEGHCHGNITKSMIGKNGFGYDPIFFYPKLNKTFAELTVEEKNEISHRGIALMKMTKTFSEILQWINFFISN